MEQRINMIAFCDGSLPEQEAREEFTKEINQNTSVKLSDEAHALVLFAWRKGFNSCHDIIYNSLKRGNIMLTRETVDGTTIRFLPRG